MPTVSLIVPVYNAAPYLKEGVASLTAQTFRDIEILLVDDGSTDGSAALCDELAAEDERIRVIHKENGGAGSARNAGMDAARGTYLQFPDADDRCLPEMTATLLAAAEESGADVVIAGYQSFDEAGDRERVTPEERLLTTAAEVRELAASLFPEGLVGYPWNKLYRASFLRDNGLRFPDMRRFQDGAFNLTVFDRATRVQLLPAVLYRYKINDLQGIFQKFPPNIFDLMHTLTMAYYDKLAEWGLPEEPYARHIRPFLLNGTVGCVDCTFSPAWGMDKAARRAYLVRLSADEAVTRCAVSTEGLSRYAALVIRLLTRRRFGLLLSAVRLKLWLKRDFSRLFFRLKGI